MLLMDADVCCTRQHHVEKSVKGELRYFRSGQKACSGLEYFGELVANFNEIEVLY